MQASRRRLVCGIGMALVAPPLARGQASVQLGFLGAASAAGYAREVEWVRAGLRDFGYVEGRNLVIEFRWAEGDPARLQRNAAELAALKVDVIITHALPGTMVAAKTTTTIPIVMADGGDPVSAGLAASLARPGRNVTGSVSFVIEEIGKRLELLREVLPRLRSAAFLASAVDAMIAPKRQALQLAGEAMGVRTQEFTLRDLSALPEVFNAMARAKIEGLLVNNEPFLNAQPAAIAELAMAGRLPAIGFPSFADAGGLLGYGTNRAALYRRVGYFVDRILKGTKPGEIPFERASKFDFIVNFKTARSLGLAIRPDLLARADRVIE